MDTPFAVWLKFHWGGGCLWYGNDATRDRFGEGPLETQLLLSSYASERLAELSAWHDTAMDWAYPRGPSLWTGAEWMRFERAAADMLAIVRTELGPDFKVEYIPMN
jgi:hypothetical protein